MKENNRIIQIIKDCPKVELHLHIEGSLEPELMFELAKRNNIKLPFETIDEVKKAYKFNNLQEFLDIYYKGANVLQTENDFYDLTYAYFKKAKEDNIVHAEIFFDPQTHTDRGIDFDIIINGIYRATEDAKKDLGITSFIIMSFLRHLSEEDAFATLEESIPHLEKIKGIGLDSSELGNPPEKFKNVFKKAKSLGLKLVAHAGEEGPTEYIWNSLNILNVDRIDHGNTSIRDKKLVKHLVETKMALTICPLSNLELKVVKTLNDHPLKKMIDLGLVVTVNSDDPAYFGGYINENYIRIFEALELDLTHFKTLVRNSVEASFMCNTAKKNTYLLLNEYLENIKN